jgi:hypothetical protein
MDFINNVKNSYNSTSYSTYLEVREHVIDMMNHQLDNLLTSNYWKEEIEGFDYMFDASPLLINKLREHCYHITGIRSYEYRDHHRNNSVHYENKLNTLKGLDENNCLYIPENPILGGFGHNIDGDLVNIDTLKFYESLIALEKMGIISQLKNHSSRKHVVIEIGAGWGGFAYQFRQIIPNHTYIIIDLPQTILFSGTYLKTIFPKSNHLFYSNINEDLKQENIDNYDFIYIPNFCIEHIKINKVNLAINMVSFQEMTNNQVNSYLENLIKMNCKYLYSHNRDRSKYNNEIESVRECIKGYFNIDEYKLLPQTYVEFEKVLEKNSFIGSSVRRMKDFLGINHSSNTPFHYRHVLGRNKI